jgi:glucose-1-phosphate cytidylyltransferase
MHIRTILKWYPASADTGRVKVVILCGGQGTRMREETEFRPKPMVDIGGKPILWHIMRRYAAYGLRDFVLCLGYRGEMIKEYFLRYHALGADFTVDLAAGAVECHRPAAEDWRVTLVDTGLETMTGARVERVRRYLQDDEHFCVTYGDGLADIDVAALLEFHRRHGRVGTVTGVYPPSRFGQLVADGTRVTSFSEKPPREGTRISGGFFVFSRTFLDHLPARADLILEREPLEGLARTGELQVYEHDGWWQCADTVRDVDGLRALWAAGDAPWVPSPVRLRAA